MSIEERILNIAEGPNWYDSRELRAIALDVRKMEERIKRLEEAGDDLCANSCPTRWDSMQAANRKLKEQDAWRKAKEAKP